MKALKTCIAASAMLIAGWSSSAFAWGADGHRAVAAIAYSLLTPTAKQAVDAILGDDTGAAFLVASTWPDEIRGLGADQPYGKSGPWHYVSIPLASESYAQPRDCKNGNCVVEKINAFNAQLHDPALLPPIRRDALAFVIHFVGDIHQPLHATENGDRGGNEVKIRLRGRDTNLHALWDSGIIRATWGDIATHQRELVEQARTKPHWAAGTPADWATEAHWIGRNTVHPSLGGTSSPGTIGAPILLPDDYPAKWREVVDVQIIRAGVRLAALLNGAFAGS